MEAFLCGTESSLNVADCVVELKLPIPKETRIKWNGKRYTAVIVSGRRAVVKVYLLLNSL